MSELGSLLKKNVVILQDEGTTLGAVPILNITGAGATATIIGSTGTIDIPGGGGATITVKDEGITQSTTVTTLDFVGGGVVASGAGATATITISGSGSSSGSGAPGIDGESGEDGMMVPGSVGPAGAAGIAGAIGPAVFFVADDGDEGAMGPPGIQGVPGASGSSATTVEVALGALATRGKFTITNAAIGAASKVLCWQAPGPYTNKGTRADEAELAPVTVLSTEPAVGSAVVKWSAKNHVVVSPQSYDASRGGNVQSAVPAVQQALDNLDSRLQALVVGRAGGNVKFSYLIL